MIRVGLWEYMAAVYFYGDCTGILLLSTACPDRSIALRAPLFTQRDRVMSNIRLIRGSWDITCSKHSWALNPKP